MVNPLPHPGADLSPTSILTTPGVMSLDLSPPPPAKEARRWDFNFLLLVQFRDREGHLRVPARHVEDGHKLGSWICTQRTRKRLGTLCPERLRRLREVGLTWNARDGKWETMFKALTKFKQREGNLRVPQHHSEDGQRLGGWICMQRYQKRLGTLVSDRDCRLNEIGFIWDAHEAKSVKQPASSSLQHVHSS
jgi:hypothetical protein